MKAWDILGGNFSGATLTQSRAYGTASLRQSWFAGLAFTACRSDRCRARSVPLSSNGCRSSRNSDEIVIGHYASMTGSEATFGQSTDNGIRMAVDEINAAGGVDGKKFRLITYDDKGDPREAATAVTRLVTNDQVTAVLGEVASKLSLEGAPICQKNGVPMITPSSTNPKVTEVGDMIFRVCFIDPFQGLVCAKFARENLKAEKAAILYDQSQTYSVGLQDEFEKAFVKLGGKITTKQAYQKGEQDFTPQLTSIRATKPDVVFIPGYYNDVGTIADPSEQAGHHGSAVGRRRLGVAQARRNWRRCHQWLLLLEPLFAAGSQSARSGIHSRNTKKRYDSTPDSMAALAYDATQHSAQCDRAREIAFGRGHRGRACQDQGFRRSHGQDHHRRSSQRSEAGRHTGNEKRRADVCDDDCAVE